MQHADEALVSVVVLERGSAWPPWLADYQRHAPDSIVIAQSSDECGRDFAQRIQRKMDEIGARDVLIHAGLLVTNGAMDESSMAARECICSALLAVMLQKRRGELVLGAADAASDAFRQELFELAGRRCEELRGTPVSVRVRFGSMRPPRAASAVVKAAPPVSPEGYQSRPERASDSSR